MTKSVPADPILYAKVKAMADARFEAPTSAYKSGWIVQEYKRRGGIYLSSEKPTDGLSRWFREQWVDLGRPIKNAKGIIIGYEPCGRKASDPQTSYPLCRPKKRINKATPLTVKEINPKEIPQLHKEKQRRQRVQFSPKMSGK